MSLKSNLFAKVFAFGLFVVFAVGCVLTSTLAYYLYFVLEAYQETYTDTSLYYNSIYGDVNRLDNYGRLLQKEKDAGLTPEEQDEADYLNSYFFPPAGSNIAWALLDADGNCLATNTEGASAVESVKEETGGRFEQIQQESAYVLIGMKTSLAVSDRYSEGLADFQDAHRWGRLVLFGAGSCLLLSIALFSFLIAAAGHKQGAEGIALNPFDRIWTEAVLFGACLLVAAGMSVFYSRMYVHEIIILALLCFIGALILFFSLIRRAKARVLFKTSFLCLVFRLFRVIFRHLRITARILGFLIAYALLQLLLVIGMTAGNPVSIFFFVTTNVALFIVVCLGFIQYHHICRATERMAAGELDNLVDENTVPFFHRIAHNLNSTGKAMTLAVEKATQSERMKTELITNVSHDIKTPLTSIISYVGLLHTTDIRDPKALEYIDILDRKSHRLGQLMADLVDASKVTSGNIAVNMEVINLGELVKQAGGEVESRLEERGIQMICSLPETPVFVYADGRHMWRVLDNLFGNAAKYALDGTRVYVDLTVIGQDVLLSVKNISRDALNIRPEELMERFVRGDASRNTEGSGLGLSIARSLMELQQGTMNIQIDGDLFKVVLGLRLTDPPAAPAAPEAAENTPAEPAPAPDTKRTPLNPKGRLRKRPPSPPAP
ncbi:MAG TPA: HAMP domain-containing histidine kinase [Firmicutes bacterium]|nr:HAMP domain-containing histidine kinase [Bacillota bacterium]